MESIGLSILAFIERNQEWAAWIMLLFAAAETTAMLSFIIPSTAVLVGVGALAATGALDFMTLWIGASAGAVLGSTLSYWLGIRYGDAILRMKPLSSYPELVEKGRKAFDKFGPLAIFIGHFTLPLRPVVFLMSGMANMNVLRFMAYNVVGCLLWAYAVLKLGEVGGMAIQWTWNLFGF